jgi:hypothetical protein
VKLRAPYPWPGGKRKVADEVWRRFGDVQNYVEPFFGSGATLLARPRPFGGVETINDKDGFVCNLWRALQAAPDDVARWADWPVNENDLHARHVWLVGQREPMTSKLEGDPEYFDAKIAGWWVWGLCCWLGTGWCAGRGPWVQHEGQLVHADDIGMEYVPEGRGQAPEGGVGVTRKRPRLGRGAGGVNRQMPDCSGMGGRGVHSAKNRSAAGVTVAGEDGGGHGVYRMHPNLNTGQGMLAAGVYRKLPEIGARGGRGVAGAGAQARDGLVEWMQDLADRLRFVRVCCGDFERVLGPTPTIGNGLTAVFLDPPYAFETGRDARCYAVDDATVSSRARAWAIANGDNPKLRIALCGYEDEHEMPASWAKHRWSAHGGYGNQGGNTNGDRETIWFSPHCLADDRPMQLGLGLEVGR